VSRPASAAARLSGALTASVVFALLVAATVGAFFVTTRLKRSAPVVEELTFARYISPNGDGRHDFVDIGFQIKKSDEVTLTILSAEGSELRVLARDRELAPGRHRFRWYGRTGAGTPAPDGEYRLRVGLRKQGRSVTSRRKLFVDTTPPRPVVRYVTPNSISPDGAGTNNSARLRFNGPVRNRPTLLVYRTDVEAPRLVARRAGKAGDPQLVWDGLVGLGHHRRPAPSGNYALVAQVQDAAGNRSSDELPATRGLVRGHPGLIVRYISALAPFGPAQAGRTTAFKVQNDGRRYRWLVRRLGSSRVLDHGSSSAHTVHVRAPRGRSGIFLLSLRSGRHRYQCPFAVQARKNRRVLVVLPATSWQARNPPDANGDGFSDLLPEDRAVRIRRPFAGVGLPVGFTAREAPLLLYLDRARLRYDITSDLALERGLSSFPRRYRGVLFAGPPRFFGSRTAALTRSYLRSGGRVAWLGTGGFTQPTLATRDELQLADSGAAADVGAAASRNLFRERLRPGQPGGQLTVLTDRIGFFKGAGEVIGPFPRLEQSARLPAGAALLASAGNEANRPSLVVYKRGRGVVARVGADGFARAASVSPPVARIMRRLWTLLSR
jgi:N,N-dimethylformamidase beta subunit-like protein/flagellar hook capping protein FlgD